MFYLIEIKNNYAIIGVQNNSGYKLSFKASTQADADNIVLQLNINELSKKIASYRYNKEVGGITYNNQFIRTDRESQTQFLSVYTSMKNSLITSIDYKISDNNWITLNSTEVNAIAQALSSHVQKCFSTEKQLIDKIKNITSKDLSSFNLEDEWNNIFKSL